MLTAFTRDFAADIGPNPEPDSIHDARIIRTRWVVLVTNPNGRRWQYEQVFETAEEAEAFEARVQTALDAKTKLNPYLWHEGRPAYGSIEYQKNWAENERALDGD